jgi:hypothetical protein
MQAALTATGRAIYLSTESNPDISAVSARPDLYGNTHRVGHDIMATWHSMLSEVDAAAGLWPFAHNDSGHGGFFNDLDMLEIGNPGECNTDARKHAHARAQARATSAHAQPRTPNCSTGNVGDFDDGADAEFAEGALDRIKVRARIASTESPPRVACCMPCVSPCCRAWLRQGEKSQLAFPATSTPGLFSPLSHLRGDWARPCRHLHRDCAHPSHICTGTGLTPPTSELHWDRAHPSHICTGTGLPCMLRSAACATPH